MNKVTHTYIYYNKQLYVLLGLCALAMLPLLSWLAYDHIVYSVVQKEVFMLLFIVGNLLFWMCMLYTAIRSLLLKKPVYVITPEGIEDCTFGFVPWDDIKEISGSIDEAGKHGRTIIRLKNPEKFFKGKLRSYFGYRTIVIAPVAMTSRSEEIDCVT